jgi:hypothetical protein
MVPRSSSVFDPLSSAAAVCTKIQVHVIEYPLFLVARSTPLQKIVRKSIYLQANAYEQLPPRAPTLKLKVLQLRRNNSTS